MSAFEFLSVGISFVLGLGVTTVLLSLVRLFRIRATVRWDWIPLAWAMMIFVAQIQYWWEMFGFGGRSAWAFGDFLLLMIATLALFVASSVILPEADDVDAIDLTSYFNETGRWALVAFACHVCLLVVINIVLSHLSPFDLLLLSQVLPFALMMATFATRSRRVQAVLTGIFLASMLPVLLSTVPSIE